MILKNPATFIATMVLILSISPLIAEDGADRSQGIPLRPATASSQNIEMAVYYLDKQARLDLVGEKNNPFLDWGGTPLTVFKVSVSTTETLMFFTDSIILRIGDIGLRGTFPENYITQYWANKLNSYSGNFNGNWRRYTPWSSGGVAYTVRRYMLHNREKAKPGQKFEKLIVFEGRLPESGTVELTIPVYRADGTPVDSYRFVYRE